MRKIIDARTGTPVTRETVAERFAPPVGSMVYWTDGGSGIEFRGRLIEIQYGFNDDPDTLFAVIATPLHGRKVVAASRLRAQSATRVVP